MPGIFTVVLSLVFDGKKDWKTLYPDGIWKTWRLF